jgi:hypothetical protein
MIRFALSVLALSAALATMPPAFDLAGANTVEQARRVGAEQQRVAEPAAAVSIERSDAPAGLGWG